MAKLFTDLKDIYQRISIRSHRNDRRFTFFKNCFFISQGKPQNSEVLSILEEKKPDTLIWSK